MVLCCDLLSVHNSTIYMERVSRSGGVDYSGSMFFRTTVAGGIAHNDVSEELAGNSRLVCLAKRGGLFETGGRKVKWAQRCHR